MYYQSLWEPDEGLTKQPWSCCLVNEIAQVVLQSYSAASFGGAGGSQHCVRLRPPSLAW